MNVLQVLHTSLADFRSNGHRIRRMASATWGILDINSVRLEVRKIVSPFAELLLLDELLVVSHGLILSVYDMRSREWK